MALRSLHPGYRFPVMRKGESKAAVGGGGGGDITTPEGGAVTTPEGGTVKPAEA